MTMNTCLKQVSDKPAYLLYHGRGTGKDKQGKKIWTRIGAVWSNKSGKGFNITWEYLPLGDGVTVMLPYDNSAAAATIGGSISGCRA